MGSSSEESKPKSMRTVSQGDSRGHIAEKSVDVGTLSLGRAGLREEDAEGDGAARGRGPCGRDGRRRPKEDEEEDEDEDEEDREVRVESEDEEASESAKEKTLMWSSWSSCGERDCLGLGPRRRAQLREDLRLCRVWNCDMGGLAKVGV